MSDDMPDGVLLAAVAIGLSAIQRTLFEEYRHAHRVPFLNFKCSACGGVVGKQSITCKVCGADLR